MKVDISDIAKSSSVDIIPIPPIELMQRENMEETNSQMISEAEREEAIILGMNLPDGTTKWGGIKPPKAVIDRFYKLMRESNTYVKGETTAVLTFDLKVESVPSAILLEMCRHVLKQWMITDPPPYKLN